MKLKKSLVWDYRLRVSNESEKLDDVKNLGLVESIPVLNIPDVVECVECIQLWPDVGGFFLNVMKILNY